MRTVNKSNSTRKYADVLTSMDLEIPMIRFFLMMATMLLTETTVENIIVIRKTIDQARKYTTGKMVSLEAIRNMIRVLTLRIEYYKELNKSIDNFTDQGFSSEYEWSEPNDPSGLYVFEKDPLTIVIYNEAEFTAMQRMRQELENRLMLITEEFEFEEVLPSEDIVRLKTAPNADY